MNYLGKNQKQITKSRKNLGHFDPPTHPQFTFRPFPESNTGGGNTGGGNSLKLGEVKWEARLETNYLEKNQKNLPEKSYGPNPPKLTKIKSV